MKSNNIEISIIVCTYNRENRIEAAVESLLNQTYNSELYEIVLVDNNSDDTTMKVCKRIIRKHSDKQINYFFEEKPGLSHARNRGIVESNGNIVAFIDDDAFAEKEWVENIVKLFRDTSINAVGGKVLPLYESPRPDWLPDGIDTVLTILDLGDQVKSFEYPYNSPCGTNMAFRKLIFDKTGFFDPDLGRIGKKLISAEETDLIFRMKAYNFEFIYSPDCVVYHTVPITRLNKSFIRKRFFYQGYSIAMMELKRNSLLNIINRNLRLILKKNTDKRPIKENMPAHKAKSHFFYEIKLILYFSYIFYLFSNYIAGKLQQRLNGR